MKLDDIDENIIKLLREGKKNYEIAELVFRSVPAVKLRIRKIYDHYGVNSRIEFRLLKITIPKDSIND